MNNEDLIPEQSRLLPLIHLAVSSVLTMCALFVLLWTPQTPAWTKPVARAAATQAIGQKAPPAPGERNARFTSPQPQQTAKESLLASNALPF